MKERLKRWIVEHSGISLDSLESYHAPRKRKVMALKANPQAAEEAVGLGNTVC